jgi:hypothetical protein
MILLYVGSKLTYLNECILSYLIHLSILSGIFSKTEIVKDLIEVDCDFLLVVRTDFRT